MFLLNTMYIRRVLFMSDSLSWVWGHLVHFAKFLILTFSKGKLLSQFSSSIKETLGKVIMVVREEYMLLHFLPICEILNIYYTLTISHLSSIAISHKPILVSCCKSQAERQGLWASCSLAILHNIGNANIDGPTFYYWLKNRVILLAHSTSKVKNCEIPIIIIIIIII